MVADSNPKVFEKSAYLFTLYSSDFNEMSNSETETEWALNRL